MKCTTTLFFIGTLPPPLHGQSKVNLHVLNSLAGKCDVKIIDLSPGELQRSMLYFLRRAARGCLAAVTLITWRQPFRVYLSLDSGLGLIISLLVVLAARVKQSKLFLHHHTNRSTRRTFLMELVVAAAGSGATHIFLCDAMREAFISAYRFHGPTLICTNARFADCPKLSCIVDNYTLPTSGEFRVGLLSNLTAEKGLYDFLALIAEAKRRNLSVVGVLAGPTESEADATAIRGARHALGGRLTYVGAVYGSEKLDFFQKIDAFLLPSHSEAYGLVIIEALAQGVPVVAFETGCIPSYLKAPAGCVVPVGSDFVSIALEQIRRWTAYRDEYLAARKAARQISGHLCSASEHDVNRLVSILVGHPEVWALSK